MKFHLPSFMLGVVAGATGATLWDRFRPILTELAAGGYELVEAAWGKVAVMQEDAEDVLAEARSRAARRSHPKAHGTRHRARARR